MDHLPLPFFIEWKEAEAIRFRNLRNDGILLPANEDLEIKECVFHVENPAKEIKEWTNLLSLEAGDNHSVILSNVLLRFLPNVNVGKERMVDVVIGPVEKV